MLTASYAVSDTYIPVELRRLVRTRASNRCEYCGIREADTWFGCEVDHIVSEKHGGRTTAENLALACVACNRAKGSDISSLDEEGTLVELFNPRRHSWSDHFAMNGPLVIGITPIGKVTIRLLKLNAPQRVEERVWLTFFGGEHSKF